MESTWSFLTVFVAVCFQPTTEELSRALGCWPGNVVPYRIDQGFSEDQEDTIYSAIGDFHRLTCLRWVKGAEIPYDRTVKVVFQHVPAANFCMTSISEFSNLPGRLNIIHLSDKCFKKNVVLHQMMHVLGFFHEHQRSDRDCYINVQFTSEYVVLRYPEYEIIWTDWVERFPYDKHSVMHYPRSTSDIWGKKKIGIPDEPLGNRSGNMTFFDLWKILFKFCGYPHYCDLFPEMCYFMDQYEVKCAHKKPVDKPNN